MIKKEYLPILVIFVIIYSCSINKINQSGDSQKQQTAKAKFEPTDGECLFFIGQDMEATGGIDNYTDGYCDYFDMPAGFTVYTNLAPGGESFGYFNKGNDGIKTIANWGAGNSCAQCYLDDPDFQHSIIAIGVTMVNNEKNIAAGNHDHLIRELGEWIKNIERPVFLRVGYEFDGWGWNNYKRKHYLSAWERIHALFSEMKIENVAFVWQSKGTGSGQDILEEWYPGDDLVDWCGYSYFGNPDEEMLTFARRHQKPVFLAEATPVFQDGNLFFNTDITDNKIAERAWKNWYIPFINTLNENKDVIKAFAYINANWSVQPMWINNPTFQQVDSRIQKSELISKKWREEMSDDRYLKASPELFEKLMNNY